MPAEVPQGGAQRQPSLLSRLAVGYYCTSFFFPTWSWMIALSLCARYPVLLPLLLAYTVYISSGPGVRPSYDGSWPTPMKRWSLWRYVAAYFPAHLHKTAELPPGRQYIFGYHPHGILGYGAMLTFGSDGLRFSEKFALDVRCLTLNLNFRVPLLREYLLLHGICSVSRTACLHLLSAGKSIAIVIGGGTESLLARPGQYDLVLRRRRGFVKIALQTGAALVPCLGFGEQEIFETVTKLPGGSRLHRFQVGLEKLTGFTLPLAYGRGIFLPWGLMPYPRPLDVVIGAPLDVQKFEGDIHGAEFAGLVDKYHALYVAALQRLFDDNKDKYAKHADRLHIVE